MKINYSFLTAVGFSCLMLLSGCSLLDKSPKFIVKGSSGNVRQTDAVTTDNATEKADGPVLAPPSKSSSKSDVPAESGKKAVKNKKQKSTRKSSVSKSELASARREAAQVYEDNESVEIPSEKGKKGVRHGLTVHNEIPSDFSIGGEWTIYSVRGNLVSGEERPYITFDLPARRFYGSNGCNIINGDLAIKAKNELLMENVIATMKMCDDAPFEYLINLAVSDVRGYSARQEGSITFLDLKGAAGNVVMVLRRHNMDFLNGAWKVTDLNGTPLTDDASITINIPDLCIHGTTGCNIFNGALFIDPDKIDSMQFINIATTRKGCPPDSRETEFLLALESVETARSLGNDTIAMYDPDGNELFKMTRIPLRPTE